MMQSRRSAVAGLGLLGAGFAVLVCTTLARAVDAPLKPDFAVGYSKTVQPLVKQYCIACHSGEKHKGDLDLEKFGAVAEIRKDLKPWQAALEMLEEEEMPPRKKPQPTPEERERLVTWIRGFLNAEAVARAGDPGFVPMRRLSNAEYDYTVRDLTGVDLQPAREFPADGAAGEGFTNAAESLADMSPTLLNKYLNAAKDLAAHAVFLPDGFRFSQGKTRRDWSDESMAKLRQFYAQFTANGRLPLQAYFAATLHYRDALRTGTVSLEEIADKEKLSPKYLHVIWQEMNEGTSFPLQHVRERWKQATEKDSASLAAEIFAVQDRAWGIVAIGSYRQGADVRQQPNNSIVASGQTLRLAFRPTGTDDVTVYLSARDVTPGGDGSFVVWNRPRLEAAGKPPLLLSDYPKFGLGYELDFPAFFADAGKYLKGVVRLNEDPKLTMDNVAREGGIDAIRLRRWAEFLALPPRAKANANSESPERDIAASSLSLLDQPIKQNDGKAAINGWRSKAGDLPVALSNSSDVEEHIPGRASAHRVVVHPLPNEFVASVWKSPIAGLVRVTATVSHAHPSCGNGVAWWIEHRHGEHAGVLAEGTVDLGGSIDVPRLNVKVDKGDSLILAIDARDGNHVCDLTETNLRVAETGKADAGWDLAADVADHIVDGNPHADRLGNAGVWSFVKGPTRPVAKSAAVTGMIPAGSVLSLWREAAVDPDRVAEADKLAGQVQALLAGPHPVPANADRALFEKLVSFESPLLVGLDLTTLGTAKTHAATHGLDPKRFGTREGGHPVDGASIVAPANSVIEVRLPAALLREREFVVDGTLDGTAPDRVARMELRTSPPPADMHLEPVGPVVIAEGGAAQKKLLAELDDFRQKFPLFTCFPNIIPVDEVVCLKMYHREDEPLARLFLDDIQAKQINRLWEEHRFISQQPVAENKYLPLFIGFVTQDQPKELVAYFEGQRDAFRKRAEDFEKEERAAEPKQLDALVDFAARAFRRPLQDKEKADLLGLYQALRSREVSHEEAFRAVLARVLVSPGFLFKIEQSPGGKLRGPVNDWELATRLSYFLWSSEPDEELRQVAAGTRLREPAILAGQVQRMLKDDRIRHLGIEFGAQWIHVRGFDAFKEKSETLYPEFDDKLRAAIYEESVLFFQDLFQQDEPVTHLIDADYTYLNEPLARHYGISGVTGPQWRKVEGVKKFGRGGILCLASVQAKQAGAARTSPVLRGNWVVETLLGEKLPRPPPDVPKLPDTEGQAGLTMRQLVEKHTSVESCAVCHQRIDPFGFAFERYDSIGRLRDKESSGLAIDSHAKLKDGTKFEGIDGLRTYLLTKKKDVIVRLFCRRLLGYALGRAVTLSDQTLIDQMVAAVNAHDGHVSAAVLEIVNSPQFRCIRGSEFVEAE